MDNYVLEAIKIYSNSGSAQVVEFIGYAAIALVCTVLVISFFSE